MQKQVRKKIFVSEIIASELAVLNCLYYEKSVCYRPSICQQIFWRHCMSQREIFSNSLAFAVINKYGKRSAVQILPVFGPPYHIACQKVLWNGSS